MPATHWVLSLCLAVKGHYDKLGICNPAVVLFMDNTTQMFIPPVLVQYITNMMRYETDGPTSL